MDSANAVAVRIANPYVAAAIKFLGGTKKVSEDRGLKTPYAVWKWVRDGLPAEHVLWLAEQTDWRWTPHQLCPDLYPNPDDGVPPLRRAQIGNGVGVGAAIAPQPRDSAP